MSDLPNQTLIYSANHYFPLLERLSDIYAIFWMSDLPKQTLIYTTTSNTDI